MAATVKIRVPLITIHRTWTIDGEDFSEMENPDVPEALMAFADQVRGNAGVRIGANADFGMKDYGNGAGGGISISMDCNQDDQTIPFVAKTLSAWVISLTEEHFNAADAKFQQMYFQKHPDKAPMMQAGPPPFKP
jgi:hypothetical protein